MHVEGHLPRLLDLLLLLTPLVLSLRKQTLGQKLLASTTQLDVQQGVVGVLQHGG